MHITLLHSYRYNKKINKTLDYKLRYFFNRIYSNLHHNIVIYNIYEINSHIWNILY